MDSRGSQDAQLDALNASDTVRSILDIVSDTTGMGLAAVAHVTADRWIAAQVRNDIAFDLAAGGELPIRTALCDMVRATRAAIIIDDMANDPAYRNHPMAELHGLQSYVAFPIILSDGNVFGTLCAFDRVPRRVDAPRTRTLFSLFAQLIGTEVDRFRTTAESETVRQANRRLEQRVARVLAEKKIYADIIDTSSAAVTALDLDGRILATNRANVDAFERIYGKTPRAGDDFLALFEAGGDHRAQHEAIWTRALAGEDFAVVQQFGEEAIRQRFYEVRFAPLLDSEGNRIGASSTSYDVTDRIIAETGLVTAQEQLRQAQKMEAMGQLTGGVAHDFNNLLTPIVASLDLLIARKLGGEREQRLIEAALQSAERARLLVQRLLAFARRQPLQSRGVDIGALVDGMADLIVSTTGPQIRLKIDIPSGLPAAHADPNQLEMALLNLSVNARDAMPDGGTLTVSAVAEQVEAGHAARLVPGAYVRLTVADTGAGMDADTLARAIEPFFSTKGVGKGTGLGLSMVDGLARQLGGALTLESQAGLGTQATLWLPASELAQTVGAPHPIEARQTFPAGVALLVEDEPLVRMSTAEMLTELGYSVVEATSADEALALLRDGVDPDVVITDHLMPGMNGLDLARVVADMRPGVPVLIVSGYADAGDLAPEFARLTKPFRREALRTSLAALIPTSPRT